jgi:hypothetical protein
MASDISSWITSAAPTSELNAPTELQRTNDFPSNRTTDSDDTAETPTFFDIDWDRLRGYEHPPPQHKRLRGKPSFVWRHGWRLRKIQDGQDYWICRHCHTGPKQPPNPARFAYVCTKATSSAIEHLKGFHRLGPHGRLAPESIAPITPLQGQSSLDAYYSAGAASERNRAAESFDYDVFKGLLTRLFTVEQIPLRKIDTPALRDLLVYLNPRCKPAVPSRNTLRAYIATAYESALEVVEAELATARTKINLSFDLWTSPGRRLSLLGVVAHYLNDRFEPRAVLLALPRMRGSHNAANLSTQLSALIRHFKLEKCFGYAITDNASENRACLNLLAEELGFDPAKRHVLCIGHIINLVAHKVLFGSDIEAFEHKLESHVTAEAVELASWRRKGPIGKLHNLIRYIMYSSTRQEAFIRLQEIAIENRGEAPDEPRQQPLYLIRDNATRWNSWYDAAERAIKLREFIDEFTDEELADYHTKLARHARASTQRDPPKQPSLLDDKLTPDDWEVIATYMTILKPCKQATMKLQGNVNTGLTKGAIWQVLPVFSELLKGFEEARQRHLPTESQTLQYPPKQDASPPVSPPTTQGPSRPTNNRRRQRAPIGKASARATAAAVASDVDIATPAASQIFADSFAQSQIDERFNFLTLEKHFSHNLNAAWQKLDAYYTRTDDTPIYRAAVFLHPKLKWRWFEKHWESKPHWIAAAKTAVTDLWLLYKHEIVRDPATNATAVQVDEDDELYSDDDTNAADQLRLYEQEPRSQMLMKDSPIPYWVSKRSIWPQLAQMALDVYSTPPMSDSPERVFSDTGHLMAPKRRHMTGESVEQITCLRSWQASDLIKLDQGLFNLAVLTTPIDEAEGDELPIDPPLIQID